jgi:hypothetical protein
MPRATRTRRTAPGSADVALLPPLQDEFEDRTAAAAEPQQDFFDMLATMSPVERDKCMVYIYRQKPEIRNGDGKPHYIEKVSPPIDEEYVKQNHGGGQYLLWLKNIESKEILRKHSFTIVGLPKVTAGTLVIDATTGATITPQNLASQPAAPSDNVVRELVQALTAQMQNKGPAVSQDELLATGMSVMRTAMGNAVQIMADTAKKNSDSVTGNPLMDKLLESAIANLTHPAPPADPMETFKTMMQTMKSMQELTGGDRPKREGMLDQLKGVAEILKTDTDGTLRGLIFGREESAPASFGEKMVSLGETILTRRPDILDNIASLLQRAVTPSGAAAQPAMYRAPALGAPPLQPAQVQGTQVSTAESVDQPAVTSENQVINAILQAIVRGYAGDHSGDAVADSLRMLFPQETVEFTQYLKLPDIAVLAWLRGQPIIAPILNREDFPEFFAEFKRELLNPAEAEEQGIAAAAPETT